MRVIQLVIMLLAVIFTSSLKSHLVKDGETVVFSFKTKSGKTAVLCSEVNENYLVYRFGTDKKTELEYPAVLDKSSWEKFTYSWYFRGGGKENEGMDLNYVRFENNGYKYEMYSEYTARDNNTDVGIVVTDKDGKETTIKGLYKSIKGSLTDLRANDKIKKEEQ